MEEFDLLESHKFKTEMENAIFWLYSHNLEQSEEFADKKAFELQNEVNNLKNHLRKTPYIGQSDQVSGVRRFPLYKGRYLATWMTDEIKKTVILLEFFDLKYPQQLREVHLPEEFDGKD